MPIAALINGGPRAPLPARIYGHQLSSAASLGSFIDSGASEKASKSETTHASRHRQIVATAAATGAAIGEIANYADPTCLARQVRNSLERRDSLLRVAIAIGTIRRARRDP